MKDCRIFSVGHTNGVGGKIGQGGKEFPLAPRSDKLIRDFIAKAEKGF